MLTIPVEVKLYPDPAAAAVKAGDEAAFRIWTIARDVAGGCPWILTSDLHAILSAIGLTRTYFYHLQEQPAFRVYFSLDPKADRIWLTSLEKVCIHYGCTPKTRPSYVPLSQFHRLKTFRAAVHAAQFDANNTFISRKHLQDKTGISPSSQLRYEANSDLEVTPTFVFAYENTASDLPIPDSMAEAQGWNFDYTIQGGDVVFRWQHVNSFRNPARNIAPRGMARKITKRLNALTLFGGEEKHSRYFLHTLTKRRNRNKNVAVLNTHYDLQDIGFCPHGGKIYQHMPPIAVASTCP